MRLRLFALILLAVPFAASAQSLDINSSADPFTLSISPQYPAPYSKAVLSLTSGSVDLASATISVSVGGKEIYKGGAKPLALTLGRAGSPVQVRVTATSRGTSSSESVTIVPQDIALAAEPVASAPVLYLGKPLVPLQGNVRVVAVANLRNAAGKATDPATYSYQWTVDGTRISAGSGIGKEALTVAAPLQYRERLVGVAVTSTDGSLVGGTALSLSGNTPVVRIYENDPLLGIRYDHALSGSHTISGTEASLYAAPYSFPNAGGAPLIQWFLNGALAQTGSSVTLRPTGNGQGSATLSLVVSAGDAKVSTMLPLIFGASTGFHLFGL